MQVSQNFIKNVYSFHGIPNVVPEAFSYGTCLSGHHRHHQLLLQVIKALKSTQSDDLK